MTNRLPAGLLDFLGAGFISSSNSAAEWSPRATALRLLTVGQQPLFADDAVALTIITNSTFDPRQVVVLPSSARLTLKASSTVNATLSNVTFAVRTIEADVNAPASTVLVIAQSYYPNWQATVDGTNAPLLHANVAFQAVPVPAGQHHVRIVYRDAKFRASGITSAIWLLLCGALWFRAGKTRGV
jgi:hypothetical protein